MDLNVYRTTDDVRAGDFVQLKMVRRLPRFWRHVPAGVEPADVRRMDQNPIIGVAEHDAEKGAVVRIFVQGEMRLPSPRKLSRWERFKRWIGRR